MKIIFLGSGNLATRLSLEMHRKGMQIGQVYSHTPENAQQLAALLGCPWTTDPETVDTDADLYVFSLKDTTSIRQKKKSSRTHLEQAYDPCIR